MKKPEDYIKSAIKESFGADKDEHFNEGMDAPYTEIEYSLIENHPLFNKMFNVMVKLHTELSLLDSDIILEWSCLNFYNICLTVNSWNTSDYFDHDQFDADVACVIKGTEGVVKFTAYPFEYEIILIDQEESTDE